jgi:hypothetical protein
MNGALADAKTPACREAAIACDGERARTLNHRLRIKADAAITLNTSPWIDAASGKNIFHRWPGEAVAENIVMVDLLSTPHCVRSPRSHHDLSQRTRLESTCHIGMKHALPWPTPVAPHADLGL